MSEWKLAGTNKTVVIDDESKKTSYKQSRKPKRVLTGTRIYVTCITNNEYIVDAINAEVLKNVSVTDSADDTSRFQATLVDHDTDNTFMAMNMIELDFNLDDRALDKQLKDQYFAVRDRVTALWKTHLHSRK
jgi:hypothetical protein